MRSVNLQVIDGDLQGLFVDDTYTGLEFTKADINYMLDDLIATQREHNAPERSRSNILAELVAKTLARCEQSHPLPDGPMTDHERNYAVLLVAKACKRGWFSA